MNSEIFNYQNNQLFIENVRTENVIQKFGTPLYVYSFSGISDNLRAYQSAFASHPTIFCYACKANGNLSLLRIIQESGWGADVVSLGELYLCQKAGVSAEKIVYSSVGKRNDEIVQGFESGILMFNVESEAELEVINRLAIRLNKKARIALRVNPDVNPRTHHYISTGLASSKFGIDIRDASRIYKRAVRLAGIDVVGCQMHIGSQLTSISPIVEGTKKLVALVKKLNSQDINIRYLDLGGGLGITYKNEKPPTPKHLADKILPLVKGLNVTLILEPGRSIIGNAGFLLTKVLYIKQKRNKNFVIVDAAMNDLIRPAFYDAYHNIISCRRTNSKTFKADVVGPVCESGDFLAKTRQMPEVKSGDYLCIQSAGAYGFSMSSNYNMRLRPAEVLVKGDKFYLIRERETLDDLLKHQRMIEV